jgi:hypothetical protein
LPPGALAAGPATTWAAARSTPRTTGATRATAAPAPARTALAHLLQLLLLLVREDLRELGVDLLLKLVELRPLLGGQVQRIP